nr:688_t:CDS:2 [Entrophospora candida]
MSSVPITVSYNSATGNYALSGIPLTDVVDQRITGADNTKFMTKNLSRK